MKWYIYLALMLFSVSVNAKGNIDSCKFKPAKNNEAHCYVSIEDKKTVAIVGITILATPYFEGKEFTVTQFRQYIQNDDSGYLRVEGGYNNENNVVTISKFKKSED